MASSLSATPSCGTHERFPLQRVEKPAAAGLELRLKVELAGVVKSAWKWRTL